MSLRIAVQRGLLLLFAVVVVWCVLSVCVAVVVCCLLRCVAVCCLVHVCCSLLFAVACCLLSVVCVWCVSFGVMRCVLLLFVVSC